MKSEEELNADPGVRAYPTVKIGTMRLFSLAALTLITLKTVPKSVTHRKIRRSQKGIVCTGCQAVK